MANVRISLEITASKFQSHNGSIVAIPGKDHNPCGLEFQSHNGSIVALSPRRKLHPLLNVSIPQWFDCGTSTALWSVVLEEFQSHNGSIVAHCARMLVRHDFLFQSHNGSIVALGANAGRSDLTTAFQSHNGSIVANLFNIEELSKKLVSIPQWFDCGLDSVVAHHARQPVSIPQWFDCGDKRTNVN